MASLLSCDCIKGLPVSDQLSEIYCALRAALNAQGDVINVENFGAVGDGVTDNIESIASAIAVMNSTGGILFFPAGEFLDSGNHTLTGPLVEHPLEEAPYRGNFIVAGIGTASVWKYTGGAGTFLTISAPDGPPSNVVFRDLQIKGTTTTPWATATIGIDTVQASVDFQFDNVQISNFQIGLRCFDLTSCGIRQVIFRHCQLGLAADFKFDACVLDRIGAQDCDVGINIGYYNSARVYAIAPPPCEGITLLSPVFGLNRIALIIGGVGTRGVSVIGGYFEGQTEASIDVGHNTTDYSGLELEGVGAVGAVEIVGCYFQETMAICRVWCPTILTFGKNGYNGPAAPFILLKNANADTSTVIAQDTFPNILGYSGGTQKSGPISTGGMIYRGFFGCDSTEIAPLVLNGPQFPGAQFQLSGSVQGYAVCTGVAGSFLTDSQVGDMIFRSESDRILFGVGSAASTLLVSGTQVVSAAPIVLPTYTVVGVPSAATHVRGLIYVSNETGGAVPAFSDGTNWRRVTDRAIIS